MNTALAFLPMKQLLPANAALSRAIYVLLNALNSVQHCTFGIRIVPSPRLLLFRRFPLRSPVFLVLTALLAWFSSPVMAEQEEWLYPVQPGDNPWNITERYLKDLSYWQRLVKLNNIKRPRRIPPGTRIKIPQDWVKLEKASVQVVELRGDVTLLPARGSPRPLTLQSILHVGDGVVVGPDSDVLLEFVDGSRTTLSEGTRAFLRRAEKVSGSKFGNTKLEIEKGGLSNDVPLRGTRFEIQTPAANTTVRGTRYRVGLNEENVELTRVEVLVGVVKVANAAGEATVQGGFGILVARKQKPHPPVRLLSAPILEMPARTMRHLPLTLEWKPVAGAEGYHAQVFALGGQLPLLEKEVSTPHLGISELPDGRYRLKVSAVDVNGLRGREGTGEFEVDARPVSPLAVRPVAGSTVRTPAVEFEWSTPPQVDSYSLQVARTPEFGSPEVDKDGIASTRITIPDLDVGMHYWRIATRFKNEQGPWSTAQMFKYRPAPQSPKLNAGGDADTLVLHWRGGEAGQRYRVQMAENEAFTEAVMEKVLDQPQWSLSRPRTPVFFRVRIIDVDGYEGPWSPIQKVFPPPEPWYLFGIPAILIMLLAL